MDLSVLPEEFSAAFAIALYIAVVSAAVWQSIRNVVKLCAAANGNEYEMPNWVNVIAPIALNATLLVAILIQRETPTAVVIFTTIVASFAPSIVYHIGDGIGKIRELINLSLDVNKDEFL